MKIYSVYDEEFSRYGHIIDGYDTNSLVKALNEATPCPDEGTVYFASVKELEELPVARLLSSNEYGGLEIQLGCCNGHNTKLNCLEYHRCSEINLGTEDFILLLAKLDDIKNGALASSVVKAFRIPAGVMVEIYATTLHFAPCCGSKGLGFRVLVVLTKGTNGPKPEITPVSAEDRLLWACNKWLLAHKDSRQAALGATVCITGENIDIANDI